MGSGSSKKNLKADEGGHNRERRPSHVDTNPPPKSDILVKCPTCTRKFASDRIQRHSEVRGIFREGFDQGFNGEVYLLHCSGLCQNVDQETRRL